MQVSKHSVELKVQLLKGEKKGAGWSAPKVLRTQTQRKQTEIDVFEFTTKPLRGGVSHGLCWACLRRSQSVHLPCAEQRELPLYTLEHLAETCSKGSKRRTDLGISWSTTADLGVSEHTHANTVLQATNTGPQGQTGTC